MSVIKAIHSRIIELQGIDAAFGLFIKPDGTIGTTAHPSAINSNGFPVSPLVSNLELEEVPFETEAGLPIMKQSYNFGSLGFISVLTEKQQRILTNNPVGSYSNLSFQFTKSECEYDFVYAYEYKDYEDLSRTIDIRKIPCYEMFQYAEQYTDRNFDARKIKTFNGTYSTGIGPQNMSNQMLTYDLGPFVDRNLYDEATPYTVSSKSEFKNRQDNYLKFWTDINLNDNVPYNSYIRKSENVFISYNNNDKKTDFIPFYVSINLRQQPSTEQPLIMTFLDNKDVTQYILSFLKNTEPTTESFLVDGEEQSYRAWDFLDWWSTDLPNIQAEAENEIFLFENENVKYEGPEGYSARRVLAIIILGMLRMQIKQDLKIYQDFIIDKKFNKSYLLSYKITKHATETGPPIQTFYMDPKAKKLLANQLSYDKTYYYNVSELRIVFGANYEYDLSFAENLSEETILNFISRPSIKILDVPIKSFSTHIVVPPLDSPHVQVACEKNKPNMIKFHLTDRLGVTDEDEGREYIPILGRDEDYLEKIKSTGYVDERGYARFFSRTATANFDVFKIDKKPESYSDFIDGYIGTVGSFNEFSIDQDRQHTFVDYIENDKVYYYLFRSVNHHEDGGRPSDVYEVYLLQDSDETILYKKVYPIVEKKKKFDTKREFRKFLQIVPSLDQVIFKANINPQDIDADAADLNILGEPTDTQLIWDFIDNGENKNFFKLRITNKSTGEKFDLNLRFKMKKE